MIVNKFPGQKGGRREIEEVRVTNLYIKLGRNMVVKFKC